MANYRKDFEQWATEYYSGFEGGNPYGEYWFCGIEYGGNFNFDKIKNKDIGDNADYETYQYIDGRKLPYWKENHGQKFRLLNYIAKLVSVIEDDTINNWKKHRENIFTLKGKVFKLYCTIFRTQKCNLYK